MSRTDNDALIEKARSLGKELGKGASLVSDPEAALAYYAEFRGSADRVKQRYQRLAAEVGRQRHLTHEIEAIFDNFFVVEAAIFDVRSGLRKDDFAKLPLSRSNRGKPALRLYYALSRLIHETDKVVDKAVVTEFLLAYQEHSPLSIRELYAIPAVLQVILVEHFGKLIDKAATSLAEYEEAGRISKRIRKELGKKGSKDFSRVISELAGRYSIVPLSLGFYLFQRLSPDAQAMRPVLKWLKLNFEKQGISAKDVADLESRQRSENSVSASNIIESLHWLTQARWENVVEEINVVDAILSKDPAGAYQAMDLESKNRYRQVVARIAEISSIHEAEIARTAVKMAQQAGEARGAESHVGFYLVDEGRKSLEAKLDIKPTRRDSAYRFVVRYATRVYFGSVALVAAALAAVLVAFLARAGASAVEVMALSAVALFLGAEASLAAVNVALARLLPVRRLASLDLSTGLSDRQRTFVVVPTMMRSVESIQKDVRKLEVRYLGNRQDNVLYALLFDFKDADQESMPGDEALVEAARREVDALNARYAARERKFYFLYRTRRWNPAEGRFMCWERKRGKLREFNMLLRGATGTTYANEEELASVPHVRYVVTLDEDTELPQDAVRKLVGCIDHPLNRPVFDEKRNRVSRGYGIIQPRAGVRIATAAQSLYSRLYSAGAGVDSYSSAISDVYQDLFGNAIFFGKGIYDVDAVERTMDGQIPDNAVLSHDLLEGIYARVGYASDIVLFDGFPKHYHEFAARLHRWIRGDWQIIGWLRRVRRPVSPNARPREFTGIDRWKIFDNLRRSMVPVVSLAALAYAFLRPPIALELFWGVLAALSAPFAVALLSDVLSIKRVPLRIRLADLARRAASAIVQAALRLAFLFHQAYVSVSAISVTVVRLLVTRKHLLEWQNSTDVGLKFTGALREFYRVMLVTQLVPAAYFLPMAYSVSTGAVLLSLCAAWFLSPLVAYAISRPREEVVRIAPDQAQSLRSIAYRTARYFLDFSRAETNWLIQDHHQEHPKAPNSDRLATSPTNLGMLFASLFSAYELGYLPLDKFIDRSRKAFASLSRLERHRGHLYNWYDVETLEPLAPAYLSSVDSANFVMALIAFRQGIKGLSQRKVAGPWSVRGIEDGVCAVIDAAKALGKSRADRASKDAAAELGELAQSALAHVRKRSKGLKAFSDYYRLLTGVHPLVVDMERAAKGLRENELVQGADSAVSFVEHLARLVEEELAFQRYLMPHAHSRDLSVDTHASRDAKLSAIYERLVGEIEAVPSLYALARELRGKVEAIGFRAAVEGSSLLPHAKEYALAWYDGMLKSLALSERRAGEFLRDVEAIERECSRFIDEPEFGFLYNKERGLFHIGYNVTYDRLDTACYNFLASESNSVSFVAIYKGQVAQKHWFYLGRKLVRAGGDVSLVSWGGSLFEYLTSLIYFKAHEESLLGMTARSAISVHRRHGARLGVPWGMGESAYYLFDAGKHYQYQVFGSPRLGLKRGLADYVVVAPYVTALSLSFEPRAAVANMRRLANLGAVGAYGFYDALDYMNERRERSRRPNPTRIYYAHHQGFTLLGIHNALDPDRVRTLFHSDPRVASLESLLEEKMPPTPAATTLSIPARLPLTAVHGVSDDGTESRRYIPVRTPYPRLAFIGNGTYSVEVSNSGAGISRYKEVSLTRSSGDQFLEESGTILYIRTESSRALWSPSVKPFGGDPKRHRVVFYENKAELSSSNGPLSAKLEVAVDPDLPVEVRSLTISNSGQTAERATVASYGEVALATFVQQAHHPRYQALLVSSEYDEELGALIYSRPHPSDRTRRIYFAHMLSRNGLFGERPSACVDREAFIGRGRSLRDPIFFERTDDSPIRRHTLDPIFSLSRTVELRPGASERLVFVSAAHEDRDELVRILRRFKKARAGAAVAARAIARSAASTKSLGITQDMAAMFQELAAKVVGGRRRDASEAPETPLPYIHSLWKLGISGDYPVAVMKIKDIEDLQAVKHALLCHSYWKHKGVEIDLVILNQEPASYVKVLDDEIDFLLRQSRAGSVDSSGAGIHHVKAELTEDADRKALLYVARAVLDVSGGALRQEIREAIKPEPAERYPAKHVPTSRAAASGKKQKPRGLPEGLEFKNAWGGLDPEASEYVMELSSESLSPAPWANVIAQPEFGTVVTESGASFTWSKDSYDNRVTAWQNDPVAFKSSEVFYLRDEETGEVWCPTPLPVRSKTQFVVRHGKGYTSFEHSKDSLSVKLEAWVPLSHPAKIASLKIRNSGTKKRSLSATAFLDPALGSLRDHTRDFIRYSRDPETGAVFMGQKFRNQLPGRVAFADLHSGAFDVTTDKAEFLGRGGSLESPAALRRAALSNRIASGTSNCAALQSVVEIEPGEEKEIVFVLGEAAGEAEARKVLGSLRAPGALAEARAEVDAHWRGLRGSLRIETPDRALDAMFNGQLLYQALSSRLWAKTGLYQPSGAFGFRDQLQDVIAFVWSRPADVRSFILKAAAHQFKEGDALNWWHDHNGFGARSVLSDHQLWLAYATLEYVSATGDEKVLDEVVPFLEGPSLSFSREQEWAGVPRQSAESASLYEHCLRAIAKSSVFGEHGLPLIGKSDWNDGLSRAGIHGRGESVWNGWFLGHIADRFGRLAAKRGDAATEQALASLKDSLAKALDKHAWDGRWYKRAFLDSGIAVGSKRLSEFKIDSVAQSWATLSGIAKPERADKALESAFEHLCDGTTMKLLAPAIESSLLDPGYVRDYPPGVRENGAQYNHAALWMAAALLKAGHSDKGKLVLDLVNPLKRTDSPEKAAVYRAEPYAVASDVYAEPSYNGRGGWTWYTGSAGVMYRVILQNLMGLVIEGDSLSFSPSLPSEWTECSITYKRGASEYAIRYEKPAGAKSSVLAVTVNGEPVEGKQVKLADDGRRYEIKVTLGTLE